MKRFFIACVVGAVIAVPVGAAAGQGLGQDDGTVTVPASECPEAVAALEAVGRGPFDTFADGCPDPASIEPLPDVVPVLDRAEACKDDHYAEDPPAWCPSDAEIAAARGA